MNPLQIEIDGVLEDKSYDIILAVLRSRGITRAQLANQCGVSAATAGKIVSALLCAGHAIAESDLNGRAEIIKPAESLRVLVVKLSRRKLNVFLCDMSEEIIFSCSKKANDSLPIEQEIIRLILSSQNELEKYISVRPVTVILCEDGAAKPDIGAISAAIPSFSADIILRSRDCTERYINRVYPNDTTLFVNTDEALDIRLFSEGRTLRSNHSTPPRLEQTDERFVISHLARTLSSLFNITLPERIIIESEDIPFDRRALDMLREEIRESTPLSRGRIPEIITNTASALDVKEAVDTVRKRLADIRVGSTDGWQ